MNIYSYSMLSYMKCDLRDQILSSFKNQHFESAYTVNIRNLIFYLLSPYSHYEIYILWIGCKSFVLSRVHWTPNFTTLYFQLCFIGLTSHTYCLFFFFFRIHRQFLLCLVFGSMWCVKAVTCNKTPRPMNGIVELSLHYTGTQNSTQLLRIDGWMLSLFPNNLLASAILSQYSSVRIWLLCC